MQVFMNLRSAALAIIFSSAIFAGCGGGGGSDDAPVSPPVSPPVEPPVEPPGAFSPEAYAEATDDNRSLSGIWMMLEDYERDVEYTEHNYDASSDEPDETVRSHSVVQRRSLYVIADTDSSPSGQPRISTCFETEDLDIYNDGRLAFSRDGVSYVAEHDSNSRITGTSSYSSSPDDYYDYYDRKELRTGHFTLVKIAPLPEDFTADASSDASGDAAYLSYADFIEPIGSMLVAASNAYSYAGPGAVFESVDVKCFTHIETTYSGSDSSGTFSGTSSDFSAGTAAGDVDIYVYRNQPDGEDAYVEIGGNTADFWFDMDNDNQNDEITGTSNVTIQGITEIHVDASIRDAEEGTAEVSIDITLP